MRIRIQEASHPRCGSRSTSVEYLTTLDYRGMRLWSDLVHVGWKCRPCHSCQCWGARSLWGSAARAAWADTPGGNAGGTWRIRPRRACPEDQWSSPPSGICHHRRWDRQRIPPRGFCSAQLVAFSIEAKPDPGNRQTGISRTIIYEVPVPHYCW